MSLPNRVTCQVPGSTSNCGSGFDTLGMALSIYNRVTIARCDSAEKLDTDIVPRSSMAQDTIAAFFKEAELEPFQISVEIEGEVPQARGLGSSVTVRGGILLGLQTLCGLDWRRDKLVSLLTALEGHPDNASASILGGFTVSQFGEHPGIWKRTTRFEIGPNLRFMVVAPEYETLTADMRSVMPTELPHVHAVTSINSVSCVIAALASGDGGALQDAVRDFMHEPYRLKNIPGAAAAIEAGIAAGAYTGWLSGSGSSVLCVCSDEVETAVGDAMKKAFQVVGLDSVAYPLVVDNQGISIL